MHFSKEILEKEDLVDEVINEGLLELLEGFKLFEMLYELSEHEGHSAVAVSEEVREYTGRFSQSTYTFSQQFTISVDNDGGVIQELVLDIVCGIFTDLRILVADMDVHALEELEEVLVDLIELELVTIRAPS